MLEERARKVFRTRENGMMRSFRAEARRVRGVDDMEDRDVKYVIDVTDFRALESYEGFPKETTDLAHAESIFEAEVARLSALGTSGTFTVRLSAVTSRGESNLKAQLVNSKRASA